MQKPGTLVPGFCRFRHLSPLPAFHPRTRSPQSGQSDTQFAKTVRHDKLLTGSCSLHCLLNALHGAAAKGEHGAEQGHMVPLRRAGRHHPRPHCVGRSRPRRQCSPPSAGHSRRRTTEPAEEISPPSRPAPRYLACQWPVVSRRSLPPWKCGAGTVAARTGSRRGGEGRQPPGSLRDDPCPGTVHGVSPRPGGAEKAPGEKQRRAGSDRFLYVSRLHCRCRTTRQRRHVCLQLCGGTGYPCCALPRDTGAGRVCHGNWRILRSSTGPHLLYDRVLPRRTGVAASHTQ